MLIHMSEVDHGFTGTILSKIRERLTGESLKVLFSAAAADGGLAALDKLQCGGSKNQVMAPQAADGRLNRWMYFHANP